MPDRYENLTPDEKALINRFPTFTAEELEDVNNMFQHYVFYKTVKDGRKLWTSCCHVNGKHYPLLQQLVTPEHRAFMGAKHNDKVTCPYCGADAILKSSGLKKGSLGDSKYLLFLHSVAGELYAQAYCVRKDYINWGMNQEPRFAFEMAYHFRLGKVTMFWEGWSGKYAAITEEGKIGKKIKIKEPFNSGSMFVRHENYKIIHYEALKESSLKYCQYDMWRGSYEAYSKSDYSLIRYLTLYCIYPHAVEMLMKSGMRKVVSDMLFNGKKNAAALKWDETDPRRAFGLDGNEVKQFMELPDRNVAYISTYKLLKKKKVKTSIRELYEQQQTLGGGIEILKFTKVAMEFGTTPKKFISYLERYTGGCHAGGYRSVSEIYRHWTDYIEAAKAIGYDLEQRHICFPRDLQEAHDNATAEHNRRLAEERARQQAEREATSKREKDKQRRKEANIRKTREKKYTWEADGFIIRPAKNAEEIIAEGNALSHCVGGYAERHERGALTILFMRKASEPDTPFLTIELDVDGELMQIHGYKNEIEGNKRIAPDPKLEYKHILDPWLAWIAAGSKRDKAGKPIIKKQEEAA